MIVVRQTDKPAERAQNPVRGEGGSGWMRTEISTLFELPTPPRRPEDDPRRESAPGATSTNTSAAFSAPALSTPSVAITPGKERPKRVFHNITEVGESSLFDRPRSTEDSQPIQDSPAGEDLRPAAGVPAGELSHDSLRARLRSKLDQERVEARQSSSSRTTLIAPQPPVDPQPPAAKPSPAAPDEQLDDTPDPFLTIADDLADALKDKESPPLNSNRTISESPGATAPIAEIEQKIEPEPASEPAPKAERQSEPDPDFRFEAADHQGPWELRVDSLRYDPVDQKGLALLLKTGIWADALELQTQSGHWVPLSRHPVYPAVRQLLLRQTQKIVAQVSTSEWPRDDIASPAPSPASPPASPPTPPPAVPEPDAPTESNDLTPEPAQPAPTKKQPVTRPESSILQTPDWALRLLAVLIGVLTGLVALLIHDVISEPQTTRENSEIAATTASQPHPTLTVPAPSESDDMSAEIAISHARAQVARAHSAIRLSQGLLAKNRPKDARRVLLDAMMTNGVRPDLKKAFNQAIAADPALHAPPRTLGVDEPVTRIYALGGGRSISLRVTQGQSKQYSFKPAQKEWGQGWRGELAAYHFCEIVPCHFESPRNRAARISRARFETHYAFKISNWQASYAQRFDDLNWTREAGPDGVEREYLYGTLEDWVPHFVTWPIEYTQLYDDLLDIRFHPDDLNISYAEAISPLKTLGDGHFYATLLPEKGDATVRDIARQISSLLVFDYLTQNWDRFSSTEKYFGVNNQFAAGRFISLDNGSSFYDEDVSKVVGRRFELTSRFSRSMVTAIRALDPAVVNTVLFPNANLNARQRLRLFWQQREQMLERVDALIEKYGAERVYEFE